MFGLKKVKNRRDDALSRTSWQDFESLLADHYRRNGYEVEHVGTGRSGTRFDGGIDLKLRRGSEYVLVQCKHWNARQVPHNDVHQLIGVVLTEEAQRGVLVTSGEFTVTARQKAQKSGVIELIDGNDLRRMLEPMLDAKLPPGEGDRIEWSPVGSGEGTSPSWAKNGGTVDWNQVFGRAAAAAVDAYAGNRWNRPRRRRRGGLLAVLGVQSLLWTAVLNVVMPIALLLGAWLFIQYLIAQVPKSVASPVTAPSPTAPQLERPRSPSAQAAPKAAQTAVVQQPQGIYRLSDEEIREWERRNAESMKVLEEGGVPELKR